MHIWAWHQKVQVHSTHIKGLFCSNSKTDIRNPKFNSRLVVDSSARQNWSFCMWCQFCQAKSLISLFQHNIESVWLNKLSLFRWKMTRIERVWLILSLYKTAEFLFCKTEIVYIFFSVNEKIAKNEKPCSFIAVVFCGYNHRCEVNEQNCKLYVMILKNIWLKAKASLMLCKRKNCRT